MPLFPAEADVLSISARKGKQPFFDVVADFGAKSGSAHDATESIQDAIDAAGDAGGGVVFFPAGFYYISASLVMHNFVTLMGAGGPMPAVEYGISLSTQSTIVLAGAKNFNLITNDNPSTGNTGLKIIDIQLYANVSPVSDVNAIYWQRVRRSLIDNVYVEGGATTSRVGIGFNACEMDRVYRSFLAGCGILTIGSEAINIIDTEVGSAGIRMETGFFCQVKDCQLYNNGVAVGVDYPSWRTGLYLFQMTDTLAKDNSILAYSYDGLALDSCQNCQVKGNVINDNARFDSTRAGILLDSNAVAMPSINNLISGNRCYNRLGATQQYGIRIYSSSATTQNNKILDNDFRGNTNKEVSINASPNNVIRNNNPPRVYQGGGGTMTLDLHQQDVFHANITDTAAVTFAAPSDATIGKELMLVVKNLSGGVMGVTTFNAVFKLGGAWVNPANGFRRWIKFLYDGTNWIEVGRATVDI